MKAIYWECEITWRNPNKPKGQKRNVDIKRNVVFEWSMCPKWCRVKEAILVSSLVVEKKQGFKEIFLEATEDFFWGRVLVVSATLLGLDHAHIKERAICQIKPFRGGGAHIFEIEYDLCAPPLNEYLINKVLGCKQLHVQTYKSEILSRRYTSWKIGKHWNALHIPPKYDAYNP